MGAGDGVLLAGELGVPDMPRNLAGDITAGEAVQELGGFFGYFWGRGNVR